MMGLILPLADIYTEYLYDESRQRGNAESISFPLDENEIKQVLDYAMRKGLRVTIQGGRTGLDGLSVPRSGHILNCSRLCAIKALRQEKDGSFLLTAEGGLTLSTLNDLLSSRAFDTRGWDRASLSALDAFSALPSAFWPPAPSESGATVGGAISTLARGPLSYKYGDSSHHALNLKKLGPVITNVCLRLLPSPSAIWGITFFFKSEKNAVNFVLETNALGDKNIAALDFFDAGALSCVSAARTVSSRLAQLSEISGGFSGAVYIELHSGTEEAAERSAHKLLSSAEGFGCELDASWVLTGSEASRMRKLRHMAQESVLIGHDIRWQNGGMRAALSAETEFGKGNSLDSFFAIKSEIKSAGIESAVFGGLCAGRIRFCLLPENETQYAESLAITQRIRVC